jgi:polysaccharide biosynthesis/export protein
MVRLSRQWSGMALLVLAQAGCASGGAGPFVWLDAVQPGPPPGAAASGVAPGDLLSVRVWNAEQMGTRQRVREDGTITLFFAGDLRVAGLGTAEIADTIAARLDGVLVAPRVNVIIEEAAAEMVSLIGEVARPGRYPVRQAPTILAALSQAGGLTEFAKKDRIFVLREGPQPQRIRVTYAQLTRGEDVANGFRLRPGDTVIVE